MKTPMQELIDSVGNMAQGLDADELYDYFMEKATQMLNKEKEAIDNAYDAGLFDGSMDDVDNRLHKDYYNETFGGNK
jgi:conjugal transfer/entry exclusion protein